ncbi:uncharacterized protein LOC143633703 [Bidens hawaiensis]|uniref:uncharacterized protein LOC143633703 n=1 Tax=Bidens hawaiensis TaxID=980011 RepID=UPI004049CCBA
MDPASPTRPGQNYLPSMQPPYKVSDHIDGTEPPVVDSEGYCTWKETDGLVLQWIYGTVNDTFLKQVIESNTTARNIWVKLENIFLNNKTTRAGQLNQQFSNLTLTACTSLDNYCQKLKELANQLVDVGQPVLDSRLVTQLVQGLPPEYVVISALINQLAPSWDDARTMLNHEEMHIKNQTHQGNPNMVLAATTEPPNNRGQPSTTQGRGSSQNRGGGRGYQGRNRGGRGYNRGRGNYSGGYSGGRGYPQPQQYQSWPNNP